MPSTTVIPLNEFLETTTGRLSESDRGQIVEQASIVLDQLYAHLPHKRAMFAIDPLQRLRLLRRRLSAVPELTFHRELLSIFIELRDLHTMYILPEPFRSHVAVLPFVIEEYFEAGARRYLVSKIAKDVSDPHFQRGVVVAYWNGVPIERAVEINATTQPGGNDAARRARGVSAMTLRPLHSSLWPDEEWVVVNYKDAEGTLREARFDWRVIHTSEKWLDDEIDPERAPEALAGGIDRITEAARRSRKQIFAPEAVVIEQRMAELWDTSGGAGAGAVDTDRDSRLPDNFSFRSVKTSHGEFGYVRIWSFENTTGRSGGPVSFIDAFAEEFRRILSLVPQNGLIIDVRGNGGGRIPAGERILELLTPAPIVPASLHFRNTPLIEALCRLAPAALEINQWEESVAQAVETGAIYSRGYPFAPFARDYNRIGQQYYGPVLLIIDALCYSTTDIFAAGFQDHGAGPVLGIAESTGAGGANVWPHEALVRLLEAAPASSLKPLPRGASFVVAMRQVTRVGPRAGVPLEDLGVKPDHVHHITRRDLLNRNEELIERAGKILSELPARELRASAPRTADGRTTMAVTVRNIPRLDVLIDERPHSSLDTPDGSIEVELRCAPRRLVELLGWEGGRLVARRKVWIEGEAPRDSADKG